MNKDKIVDELNRYCEYVGIDSHWDYRSFRMDRGCDRSRSYCASTRTYWRDKDLEILLDRGKQELCNSCGLTLAKYKNLYTIETEKPNALFEKIFERLDVLEKITRRIETIEHDIKMIKKHLKIDG